MGAIELRRVDTARGSCRGSVLEVAWFRTASNKRQKVYWVQTLREIKERYMYIMCIYIYTQTYMQWASFVYFGIHDFVLVTVSGCLPRRRMLWS